MGKTLLEIGCDGGSITINSKILHGIFIYQIIDYEIFTSTNSKTITFITLNDAWKYLKQRYPKWYQLHLIQISTQMTDLLKRDYILANDKNECTKDRWLQQLTGLGLGF